MRIFSSYARVAVNVVPFASSPKLKVRSLSKFHISLWKHLRSAATAVYVE